MKLDRNRAFGQVFGSSSVGFEQDGKSFDHTGEEIKPDKPVKTPAKPVELDQVADQLKA